MGWGPSRSKPPVTKRWDSARAYWPWPALARSRARSASSPGSAHPTPCWSWTGNRQRAAATESQSVEVRPLEPLIRKLSTESRASSRTPRRRRSSPGMFPALEGADASLVPRGWRLGGGVGLGAVDFSAKLHSVVRAAQWREAMAACAARPEGSVVAAAFGGWGVVAVQLGDARAMA